MIMAVNLVNQWINDGIHGDLSKNDSLIDAIFNVLEDKKHHDELLEKICSQLFTYYRSHDHHLRVFALSFMPALIALHLISSISNNSNEKRKYQCVDVFLLGIYNLQVIDDDGHLISRTFKMPTLAKPSIYHEPSQLSSQQQQSSVLTEHALSKLENGVDDTNMPLFGPFNEMEHIMASNRNDLVTVLLKAYNDNISSLPKKSLQAFSRMCLKVLRHGTRKTIENKRYSSKGELMPDIIVNPPIPLSSNVLVELANSIYFCIFNDVAVTGLEALEEIHSRATIQLLPNVLLMTNAIRNSLKATSIGKSIEGPMGMSIALSPTVTTSIEAIAKSAITNASFKTRKLPDDIPIVVTSTSTTNTQLSAINEETEGVNETEIKEKVTNKNSIKQVTSGLGKSAVIKLLKERKKKESKREKGLGRSENGDVITNLTNTKQMQSSDLTLDFDTSDTSGISEGKSSSNEEAIPLTVLNSLIISNDDDGDGNDSDMSSNPEDASRVPLVNQSNDSNSNVQHSLIQKHNNETSINL